VKTTVKILLLFLSPFLFSCQKSLQVQSSKFERIPIDESTTNDEDLEEFISPYRNRINTEMDKVLAYNTHTMLKTDTPHNTAIGNMMADAVLELANPIFKQRYSKHIDAVLLNYGGIRAGMGKGNVTTRTAYEIMPFENMVVIAELDGVQMKNMLEFLSKTGKAEPIANMKLKFDRQGNPLTQLINGEPFDESRIYYVATSDYIAENMDFFTNANQIYDIDYKLRNLFIDYFVRKDTIDYFSDDRLLKLK
jgi:5'-nucleotidase